MVYYPGIYKVYAMATNIRSFIYRNGGLNLQEVEIKPKFLRFIATLIENLLTLIVRKCKTPGNDFIYRYIL